MNLRKKTIFLGLGFFKTSGYIFWNPLFAILFIFIHNVLAISLILLGMTLYGGLVLTFMPKRKTENVVLNNSRIFAFVFTKMILLLSIFGASILVYEQVFLNTLAFMILLGIPNAIIEGYGIFQTIETTLKRKMTLKALVGIYCFFHGRHYRSRLLSSSKGNNLKRCKIIRY